MDGFFLVELNGLGTWEYIERKNIKWNSLKLNECIVLICSEYSEIEEFKKKKQQN